MSEETATRYIEVTNNMTTSARTSASPSPATSPSTTPTVVQAQQPAPPPAQQPPNGGNTANVYLIGLEFVRQYYTVLHQGPLYLHRFYSESSSYVHDDNRVVFGQQEIRERIQQLNFRNCVAKILQVDSQDTVGDGVVIQVRGELSNNGKPLRRFMQTFVLAPQSPKRYFVRNDIFHYEDDDPKEDLNASTCLDSSLSNENIDDEKSEDDDDSGSHVPSVSAGSPTSTPDVTSTIIKMEKLEIESSDLPILEVSVLDTPEVRAETDGRRPSHGFVTTPTPTPVEDETLVTKSTKEVKEDEPTAVSTSATSVAKTYANLFKSTPVTGKPSTQPFSSATTASPFPNRPSTGLTPAPGDTSTETGFISPGAVSPQPPPSDRDNAGKGLPPRGGHGGYGRGSYHRGDRDRRERERLSSRSSNASVNDNTGNVEAPSDNTGKGPAPRGGHGGYGRGVYHRGDRDRRERLSSRSSNATNNDDTGSVDGDSGNRRRITSFPDSHQLFVGNLPHTVTIAEIKEIFNVFGRVAEVKILKPNMKNAGAKVPYFCFVVFEEASAAQAAINDKSKITMKMSDGSNRRLNVEEKRPREGYGNYFQR